MTHSKLQILSVSEEKGTRVQGSLFGSRHILVDRKSAETLAGSEVLIGTFKDHLEICEVDVPSQVFDEILAMLQIVIKAYSIPQVNVASLILDDSAWASTVGDPDEIKMLLTDSRKSKQNTKSAIQGTTEASFELIPTLNDFLQDRPAPKLPCYLLGPNEPIPEFVGRGEIMKEIWNILENQATNPSPVNSELSAPRSFAICGTPGLGKSRLAVEYMHKHKDKYDAMFWINADDENSLAEDFLWVAKELGLLNPSEMKDGVMARNILIEWLANPLKQAPIEDIELC